MKTEYKPLPLDLTEVIVPVDLLELSEDLARNTHEVWAFNRMNQGWTYGPIRDDSHKKHPDLIPYEELSEEEKDYDRQTAFSAIKFILLKGFQIVKHNKQSVSGDDRG